MENPDIASSRRGSRAWLPWLSLGALTVLATGAVVASIALHAHADRRRQVIHELTQIETQAMAQANIVWRALSYLMAEERLSFVRIRGEAQRCRAEIDARLTNLATLAAQGDTIQRVLGFPAGPESMEQLAAAGHSFLSSVQGTVAQMSLSVERMRDRLRYWDMNLGSFHEALETVRKQEDVVAKAASRIANLVTAIAALITLLAATLFVVLFSRQRARRARELSQERLRITAANENRLRELVRHSSDLILVVEPDGALRYATPSARALAPACADLDSASTRVHDLSRVLEAAIEAGAFDTASRAIDESQQALEALFGCTLGELVAQQTREVRVTDADGNERIFDMHSQDLTQHADIEGFVLNGRDVTERRVLEERLRHQALHDPLTNLPNRRRFRDAYDGMSTAEREVASVLFVDLDGFKIVNDSYGHKSGDELLMQVAARIGSCLAATDLLARQGGDEFLVLVASDAGDTAKKIQSALAPPFTIEGQEAYISASIGIVTSLAGIDAEQAAQRADIAMYAAKQGGKACHVVFEDEMLAGAPERLALESDFRRALDQGEFTVAYQPKVGFASGVTESLEALVRWVHPTRGFVGPDLFIPFAEETGLISELGRLVLRRACLDAVRWSARGVVVAVNLSPLQFRNPRLVDEVREALEESGLDPRLLELEITESAVLGDVDNTIEVLAELKALGIRLAIDDFGTGYSNLAHIKHFNVDVLKIDQSFVRGGSPSETEHLSDGAIVEAVIAMAKAFGLHVVAEGVESQSHASALRDLGADLGQGYFFSKPVSADEIDEILGREQSRELPAT